MKSAAGVDAAVPSRPWQSISFASTDGQPVQAWPALPAGAGPFPAVIDLHGGPHWVMTERFSPEAQLWLDHGFAYLHVNYRGSTTFGRRFQEQIWGDPGHWEVDDTVAARAWLVGQGIARPDLVFLYGWSYGAYVSLLALGQRPDLWAGAMVGAAVADRTLQYEDGSDWQKAWLIALHGGTPQEKPDLYRSASPIAYAESVRAPVFIAQGRHDNRTPARQVAAYEARLRSLGKPIEVYWFDAGHGSRDVDQVIDIYEHMVRFACRVRAAGC